MALLIVLANNPTV